MLNELIITLAIAHLLFDIGYYVRFIVSICWGKWFQKRLNITETFAYYGICTSRDAGGCLPRMNNFRYLRVIDSARINMLARAGLFDKIVKSKGRLLVGAHTVRYQGSLQLFDLYKIETKLLCWNKKSLFFEHKFITLKDGIARVMVLSRTHVLGLDLSLMMADIPDAYTLTEVPEEIRQWEMALETTSRKLRQN